MMQMWRNVREGFYRYSNSGSNCKLFQATGRYSASTGSIFTIIFAIEMLVTKLKLWDWQWSGWRIERVFPGFGERSKRFGTKLTRSLANASDWPFTSFKFPANGFCPAANDYSSCATVPAESTPGPTDRCATNYFSTYYAIPYGPPPVGPTIACNATTVQLFHLSGPVISSRVSVYSNRTHWSNFNQRW